MTVTVLERNTVVDIPAKPDNVIHLAKNDIDHVNYSNTSVQEILKIQGVKIQ